MKGFALGLALSLASISTTASGEAPRSMGVFVDPDSTTAQAASRLEGQPRHDAMLLSRIASASWFAGGTPEMVEARVRDIVDRATATGQTPILVAYNIPFRDCALYSAGGRPIALPILRGSRVSPPVLASAKPSSFLNPMALALFPGTGRSTERSNIASPKDRTAGLPMRDTTNCAGRSRSSLPCPMCACISMEPAAVGSRLAKLQIG